MLFAHDTILHHATNLAIAILTDPRRGVGTLPITEVPEVMRTCYAAVAEAGEPAKPSTPERPEPAVPVRLSVHADHIVCLEDGKKFKSLKRHLRTAYNMTPEQYRARWDLPADYPMVAPTYSIKRSELAKASGLGRTDR